MSLNYKALFNSSNDAIFILNLEDGSVIDVNNTMLTMYGYSDKSEVVGLFVEQLSSDISPYTKEDALEYIKKAIKEGAHHFQWHTKRKDGSLFWVEVNIKKTQLEGKERLFAYIRDISEQKQTELILKESEEKYRTLIEMFPHTIAIIQDGKIAFVNSSGARMFGYDSSSELIGKSTTVQIPEDQKEMINSSMKKPFHGDRDLPNCYESECVHRNGNRFPVEIFAQMITFNGRPAIEALIIDISERKKAETALKMEKEFTDKAINAQIDSFFLFNPKTGQALRWNKQFETISGYSSEEIKQLPAPSSYYSTEDAKKTLNAIPEVIEKGFGTIELNLICKSGESIPFEYNVSILKGLDGKDLFISIGRDMRPRVESEKEIKKLSEVVSQSPSIVLITKKDGTITYVNPAFSSVTGFEEKEIIGTNSTNLGQVSDDSQTNIWNALKKGEIWRGIFKNKKKDGTEYYEKAIISPLKNELDEITHYIKVAEDITEQERAKRRIIHLSKFPEENPSPVLRIAKDGTLLYSNLAGMPLLEIWGVSLKETVPSHIGDVVCQVFSQQCTRTIEVSVGDSMFDLNFTPIFEQGYANVYGRDVTTEKKAYKALIESESKYRRIIENLRTDYFFYRHNTQGVFSLLSSSVTEMLGYTVEEFCKHYTSFLTDNPINEKVIEYSNLSIQGIKQPPYEVELYHKDGRIRTLEVQEVPVFDSEGKVEAVEGIAHDITSKKEAQELLWEEKFRAELYLDLLSHDINNRNQGVITFLELLQYKNVDESKGKEYVTKALEQAKGISKLVNNVRKLSMIKEQEFEKKPIDVVKCVKLAAKIVKQSRVERDIVINYNLPDQILLVKSNNLLLDVFENIIGNAVKYDSHKQVIIDISYEESKDGNNWNIKFADRGHGVSDEAKNRIFKRLERGEESIHGTGLGLAIVNEVVKRCGGSVWIENRNPNNYKNGSILVVSLPKGE